MSAARKRGRWMLVRRGLECAATMLASYFTYYVIKPKGGPTN
ncbi:cytochrome C oxidase subunit I, partial [Burkholderia multivorans]